MSLIKIHDLLTRIYVRTRQSATQRWARLTSPRWVSAHTLSDEAFLSLFDLGEGPPSKKALMTHYGRRATPAWPAPPSILRDLRISTDEIDRKELVCLADRILNYRFLLGSSAPQVTPEGKIAWHSNPTSDPEWLWALNRHQWWPILGLAYAQTHDERYAIAFVSQMLDWVKENPSPARKSEHSSSWRLMEVALRMRTSWIPCFALFHSSDIFTDDAKLTMLRSIYDHAQFLSLFRTNRNHFLRESNGLVYVGVYYPEFKQADRWRKIALDRLDEALLEQVNQDGSHFEVSIGYQSLVIDEFQNTYDLLQANDLSLPSQDLGSRLAAMYQVMAYSIRPGGTFPYVNDGSVYWEYTRLAQAGQDLGRDDLVYIGTGGERGTCPTTTSVGFGDAGLYVMRSDWSRDARYLLFDAGPFGGPHGHEDKLNVEILAFGQPFIVDSNHYTYEKSNPFRLYFSSSQAHNTVLVDGRSQIRRWYKENLHPRKVLGNYATWISQPDFDYVCASYSDGYGEFQLRIPAHLTDRDPRIIRDVTHTRRILFVKPDYWVMVDELRSVEHHDYQVLFHSVPQVTARIGPGNRAILGTAPEADTLHLVPAEPHNVKVSCISGSEHPIQGWYSPNSYQKTPATAIIYEQENSASTAITTLLYPCPSGRSGKEVSIESLSVSGGAGLAFVISTHRGRDYLLFSHDGNRKRFGSYESRGIVAGVRTDNEGNALSRFEGQPI